MAYPSPQPVTQQDRRKIAQHIARRVQVHFGDTLLALGIYGSLARGDDGPYSDIEMWAVMRQDGIERFIEWVAGPYKVQIDVFSRNVLWQDAARVEYDWPLTHGSMADVQPVFDPHGFFPQLRERILSRPQEDFDRAMRELIIDELYEMVGKIRNLRAAQDYGALAFFVQKLALSGAWMLGLAHQRYFSSAARTFDESLALGGAPAGYAGLLRYVMSGDLRPVPALFAAVDAFWDGVVEWAASRGLSITDSLDDLLAES